MKVSLRDVLGVPGASLSFSETLDFQEISFPFGRPFVHPVAVDGRVDNKAGLVVCSLRLSTALALHCDRCAASYEQSFSLPLEVTLAEQEETDSDDTVLITGQMLQTEELILPALVLAMDQKHLCREDCRGLCPHCGRDLNTGDCACGTDDR